MEKDPLGLHGTVTWTMRDQDGHITRRGTTHNLVTQVGDQLAGERMAGITTLGLMVGMKLGTGSTPEAKVGAGSYLVAWLPGSYMPFDATYPQSSLGPLNQRRVTYQCTYPAGVATSATPITEAVLTNTGGNVTSTQAQTMSRARISVGAKGASDSLTVTWLIDVLGS